MLKNNPITTPKNIPANIEFLISVILFICVIGICKIFYEIKDNKVS
ncbi:hypothetical protein BN1088_630003 [Sphingobacterium sp. PM2-P1-29]|nr:hypothetical protein BN1088_630003 [Sphingobacterium sp. PM2-P1-29]